MGRTFFKGTPALRINTEGGRNPTFAPGDTVIGYVSRAAPTVSTNAIVRITLCGRTKSKIVISRGNNNRSYYRGRFTVIDENAFMQKLFEGPLHIISAPQGLQEPGKWPFAIDIPTHCNPKTLANSVPQEQSYLPLDASAIATHPLPDTFSMDHDGFNTDREGFVEYFLKATIWYMHGGSSHNEEAILPINIRSRSNDPPIADFRLRRHRVFGTASSYKLLPGMEDAELTFSQKRQQLFGSPKVPKIGGQMEIDVPRVIQLDNPNPVHIQLRFVPDAQATSSGLRGVPAKIRLVSMHMKIGSKTDVRCDGTFHPHDADDTDETSLRVWPPARASGVIEPLYIPCTDEWPAIDVGERAGFRVPGIVDNNRMGLKLYPDFSTYNIKHSHNVRITLIISIVEKEIKMGVSETLKILPPSHDGPGPAPAVQAGPSTQAVQEDEAPPPPFQGRSESWIHPPAEGDAPPTFAQVEKEDMARKKSHDGRPEDPK